MEEYRQNLPLLVCAMVKDLLRPELKPNERSFALQNFLKILEHMPPEMKPSVERPRLDVFEEAKALLREVLAGERAEINN